jgi:hypothetical protein
MEIIVLLLLALLFTGGIALTFFVSLFIIPMLTVMIWAAMTGAMLPISEFIYFSLLLLLGITFFKIWQWSKRKLDFRQRPRLPHAGHWKGPRRAH